MGKARFAVADSRDISTTHVHSRRLDGHPGRSSSPQGYRLDVRAIQSWFKTCLIWYEHHAPGITDWLPLPFRDAFPLLLPYPLSVIYTFNLLEPEEFPGGKEEEEEVERSGRSVDLIVSFGSGLLFQFHTLSGSLRSPVSLSFNPLPLPHARLIARYLRDNWARLGEKSFAAESLQKS